MQNNKIQTLSNILWLIIILLSVPANAVFAKVIASTDRTTLSIDESINLQIKSDNNSAEPDFSVLNTDFQILGKSQSQNYSLINGVASRSHTWNISLLPLKTGKITIPAIKVGKESTQAIHLLVKQQSSSPGVDGKDVYLKTFLKTKSSDNKTYYVQQQIMLSVQIFHRIGFANASLNDLKIENTVIEKIGEDANYSKTVGKHRYNIIERRYAIYPQQSGPLTIPALTFTGRAEIQQSFSLFSQPGRRIISRSKPIKLTILPVPDSYTGKLWLPAAYLSIEAKILEDSNTITAGEAITRHIIVTATGLLGSQLPAITIPASKAIKTYPDKEQLHNQLLDGEVTGSRTDTIAIIPLKPGSFTLPEITIDWWNTTTNQQESAHLPAQTLSAQPNSEQTTQTEVLKVKPQPQQNNTIVNTLEQIAAQTSAKELYYKDLPLTKNNWFWVSIALFIVWLLTLLSWLISSAKYKHTVKKHTPDAEQRSYNHSQAEKHLHDFHLACYNNDAYNSSQSLVQWAEFYFNKSIISDLAGVIELTHNKELTQAIMELESCQYSQEKEQWQGKHLSTALKNYLQQKKNKKSKKIIEPQAFSSLNP